MLWAGLDRMTTAIMYRTKMAASDEDRPLESSQMKDQQWIHFHSIDICPSNSVVQYILVQNKHCQFPLNSICADMYLTDFIYKTTKNEFSVVFVIHYPNDFYGQWAIVLWRVGAWTQLSVCECLCVFTVDVVHPPGAKLVTVIRLGRVELRSVWLVACLLLDLPIETQSVFTMGLWNLQKAAPDGGLLLLSFVWKP